MDYTHATKEIDAHVRAEQIEMIRTFIGMGVFVTLVFAAGVALGAWLW